MAAEINEKTKLPLGLILTIVAILIPLAGWINAASTKVDSHIAVDEQKWLRQADADLRRDSDITLLLDQQRKINDLFSRLLEREARQAPK
jgi:hypothetical protein